MTEYNTQNEHLKKQYEEVLLHQKYWDEKTVKSAWESLNNYERFTCHADFTSFNTEQAKEFKHWYLKQTGRTDELLSISTVRSTLKSLRDFFGWLAIHPTHGKNIHLHAVGYLRLSDKQERAGRATRPKPTPSVEQINAALLALPNNTPMDKRDRGMMAFAALTGMRDSAIISLKMKDVDMQTLEIWQDPKHVKTKNSKAIATTLMTISPLWLEIFTQWHDYASQTLQLPPDAPLFPKTLLAPNPITHKLEGVRLSHGHWKNAQPVRNLFKRAFEAAGEPYFHPHSFRRTISHWAMEHCTQLEYKAISQNIGHEHSMTTYNAYGELPDIKRSKLIADIGNHNNSDLSHASQEELVKELQRRMQ